MGRLLRQIDAHIARTGAAAEGPEALRAVRLAPPPTDLDLAAAGIGTVVWATGYRRAYPWLDVPVLDAAGELVHSEGVTPAPGLFALGLRFQRRRNSHFIGGVGDDAARIAVAIAEGAGARELARAA
jgi:putative flavoprotein involved in K+ transport